MHRTSLVRRAPVIAGLALGIIFSVGSPSLPASAQVPTHIQAAGTSTIVNRGGRDGLHGVRQLMLDAAARTLRITTTDLVTRLRNGQTLAQIAQAQGTTQQAVLNAALAAAKTRLDQLVANGSLTRARADAIYADLQQRGAQVFNYGGRGRGGVYLAGVKDAMLTAAAGTLRITTTDLVTRLRNGQTLAQIAQAQGTTQQAVLNAALAAAKTRLDQLVANGTITRAQADAVYAELQQRGAQVFNQRGGRGR